MKWWKIVCIILCIVLCTAIAISAWHYVYKPIDSPREGFTTTTSSIDTSYAMKSGSTTNAYTIFDPTGAYLQAGIYSMEYGPALSNILISEANFTTTILPQLLTIKEDNFTNAHYDLLTQDTLRNIANLGINIGTDEYILSANTKKQYSVRPGASDRLSTVDKKTKLYNRLDNPTAYYTARDTKNVSIYDHTAAFINNPIGFILSGKKLGKLYINCGYKTLKRAKIDDKTLTFQGMATVAKNTLSSGSVEAGLNAPQEYTLDEFYNLFNIIEASRYKYDSTYVYLDAFDSERCYPYQFEPYDYCEGASVSNFYFQNKCPANSYHRRSFGYGPASGHCTDNGGIIKQSEMAGRYRHDGDPAPKFTVSCYNNSSFPVRYPSKYCKEIPEEISYPSIPTTILSNPSTWTVRSFMSTTASTGPSVKKLIDAYNATHASGSYNSINVVGTISDLAKTEVQKSVGYAMYFNFTDTASTEKQILVGSTIPCNLYMSKTNSASVEFVINISTTTVNISTLAVTSNSTNCNTPITDDMMKMLPYHTRNYIRKWALSRRERIANWYVQKCTSLKNSLDATYNSAKSAWEINHTSSDALSYINFSNLGNGISSGTWPPNSTQHRNSDRYALTERYPFDVLNDLNQTCPVNPSTRNVPVLYNPISWDKENYSVTVQDETESLFLVKYISGMKVSTIQNRTYSEIYPYYISTPTTDVAEANTDTNTTSSHDIAPKFDLMSISNSDPAVFSAATPSIVVTLTRTTTSPQYSTTMTISNNVAFLSTSMTIALTDISDPTTYLKANVASYQALSGVLTLNQISVNNVYVNSSRQNGTTPASWKPFGTTSKYYQISYTDTVNSNTFIGTDTEIKTVYAQQFIPLKDSKVDLIIRHTDAIETLLVKDTAVTVSNYNKPTTYFNATIVSYVKSESKQTATVRVNATSTPVGTYTIPVTYIISLGVSASSGRYWLNITEKRTILNMIAQFYYENNTNNEMNMILDVFQVGDLLYDVRFIDLRSDSVKRTSIAGKMDVLRTKHETYRGLLLSEDQRLTLEDEYNTQMIKLNTELSNALVGVVANCGVLKAQKVRLKRTDSSTTGISLAQIIIVDNTGTNVAYTKPVTTQSTYIPSYLIKTTSNFATTSANGTCAISSTGAITCTNNGVTTVFAPAGTCLEVQETGGNYTSKNCLKTGTAVSVTPTSSTGNSSGNTVRIYKQKQLLTDGNYTPVPGATPSDPTTFTWNTTPWSEPYYYKSSGTSTSEYVEIDLLRDTDITGIYIIYPMDYTETPTYSISLYDSDGTKLEFPTGYTSTITKTASQESSFLSLLATGASAGCINSLNEPYTVARFYSTIDKNLYNNNAGNPTLQLTALRFTGYSLGTKAALTFNPKYNAGFIVDLAAGLGNTNYRPTVTYTKNTPTLANPLPQGTRCLEMVHAKNIIYDHYTSLLTYDFTQRSDVQILGPYDTSTYIYKPSTIMGLAANSNGSCGIKWSEITVNPVTNKIIDTRVFYGIFKYQTNYENWGATDSYYDIANSRMFNSLTAYTNGGGSSLSTQTEAFNIDLPAEGILDTLGGSCPPKSCSDIDVINNIVQSYNDDVNNTSGKIIRITQAVTVSSSRCDFKGIIQTPVGTSDEIVFTMNIGVRTKMSSDTGNSLSLATTECKYYYTSIESASLGHTKGGEFIQPNTPYLLKAYNYAVETIRPYVKFFNDTTYSSLLNTVNTMTPVLSNSLLTYRKDMYGAYGQLNTLTGGTCKDTDTHNVCTDPITVNEFMKAYRKYRIINSVDNPPFISTITHAGTAYNNTCDYVANTYTLSIENSVPVTTNPQTAVYRVKMNPVSNTCYFTTTVDSASNITVSANTDVNYKDLTVINYTANNYVATFLGIATGVISSTSISVTLTINNLIIAYNQPVSIQYGGASLNGYLTPTASTTDKTTNVTTTSINISNIFSIVGTFPSESKPYNIYTSNTVCEATGIISNPQLNDSISLNISVLLNDSYIGAPVIVKSNPLSMNGIIQFYSATTVTVGSISNVQGSFTSSSTKYTISLNYVKQIQLNTVPTALNRNTWETPITLGTQTTNTILSITPTTTSVTLTVPSLQYTSNRKVYVVDMNNSANNFNAIMTSYLNSVVTLETLTNKNGSYTNATKYRIFSIVPITDPTAIQLVEMIDYVNCASNPYTPGTTNQVNKSFICSNGVVFSQSSDPTVNSVVTTSSSYTPVNIEFTTPLVSKFLPYPDVVTSVNPQKVTSTLDTYEFRVTTQDYLPYGDTYKFIQFYNPSAPKVLKVTDSNVVSSKFTFFYTNSVTTNLDNIISCARDSWNISHLSASETPLDRPTLGSQTVATPLTLTSSSTTVNLTIPSLEYTLNMPVKIIDMNNITNNFNAIMTNYANSVLTLNTITNINGMFGSSTTYKVLISNTVILPPSNIINVEPVFKSVINKIDGYYLPENKNTIIFRATAADFGINGETDIRVYGTTRYFLFEFRQKYNTVGLTYNVIDTVSSTNNPVWKLNSNNTFFVYAMSEVKYTTASPAPAFTSITPSIVTVPTGTIAGVTGSSTLLARPATYIVQPLLQALTSSKKFRYLRLKFTASASTSLGYAEITYIKFYNTNTANPTHAFITNSNNTVQLQYASFTVEDVLPVRYYLYGSNNVCDTRLYTQSTDANGTTFGVCTLTNIPSLMLSTRTFTTSDISNRLPCPIGYENDTSNNLKCNSTGNFRKVNLILESTPNPTTPRLKLPLNKYLYINLNDEVQIKYFTFTTGASAARPTAWILEGSMSGNQLNANEWVTLHSVLPSTAYQYNEAGSLGSGTKINSFIETSCFPILTGGSPVTRPTTTGGSGLGYNFTHDPSTDTATPIIETFKNPVKSLLRDSIFPTFEEQRLPKLEVNYSLPLQTTDVPKYSIPERRVQYLRFTVTETRKRDSPIVHMSMLQFITPLGPLPMDTYTISNPMGIHPSSKTTSIGLNSPTGRWVNLNRNPLLIKFGILPPTLIQGFQFSVPSGVKDSEDAVPSQWLIESSYDGRFWEIFEETDGSIMFNGNTSPVYRFSKQI
jgi:hypothetical protein